MRQLKAKSSNQIERISAPMRGTHPARSRIKNKSFFSTEALLDRFSFANVKPKQNQTERIRAKRNRSQVLSWFIAATLIALTVAIAVSVAFGLPQKLYISTKDRLILFSGQVGLDVRDVFVEGRKNASLDIVMSAVQVATKTPILLYDIEAIRDNLLKIDWIKTAIVQRRLPNLLYIRIIEREPIALWQQKGKHLLVDKEGVVIKSPIREVFSTLPLVAGINAPAHTPKLVELLHKFPTVMKHLTAMIRIRERRWDLTLDKTIVIKLPEEGLEDALARLSKLIDARKIIADDVLSVDLRLPKQVIMRLTPEAAVRVKIRGKEKV
ncbi:MAG: cell division protein FtsQ/DivIB [Candidatus Paracaedibacteraceae bacterium]|nr:cell division protein FtsQ/DivIB [Candidatus Paracaedibacteraceae bacterium]